MLVEDKCPLLLILINESIYMYILLFQFKIILRIVYNMFQYVVTVVTYNKETSCCVARVTTSESLFDVDRVNLFQGIF